MIVRSRLMPKSKRRRTAVTRSHGAWRRFAAEPLEARVLLAADLLHNVSSPTDVNDDGYTSPMDALHVLNELNSAGARSFAASSALLTQGLFYDVNDDHFLSPMDALLVLNELNGEGDNHDLVQIRLQTTDGDGNPISSLDVGQAFQLRAFVQDLTAREDGGVFAGYVDVEYNSSLVSVTDTSVTHGTSYGNARSGDLSTAGLMDEVGSIDGLSPLGPDELLLFTVNMVAHTNGTATFVADAADLSPAHDILLFGVPEGEASSIVPTDRIAFVGVTLQIGSEAVPQAVDDTYEVTSGDSLTVDAASGVLANDVNPGPGDLTATLMADVTNGELTLASDGSFTYTPDNGFTGQDTFTYVAALGEAQSNVATVTIDVLARNAAPVAVDDTYSTDEDLALTIAIPGVLANDTDADGDSLTVEIVTNVVDGSLTLNADGSFTYTPNDNFSGTDSFEYTANDGTVDSNVATVTLTVNPINDVPVAVDDGYLTPPNTTLVIDAANGVLKNDTDVDGDTLSAELVTDPANGTLDLAADGSFTYVPEADFVGQDTFTYAANDGTGASEPATVTITVTGTTLPQVRIRLEIVNSLGNPVTAIGPGSEFTLNGYVQDVSGVPRDGVFAAYMDVVYDATVVSVNGPISYGSSYPNQQRGNTTVAGLIDEVGAFDGLNPLGDGELLLFSVPMIADSAGTSLFTTDPADQLPAHDVLLFNQGTPVPPSEIDYGTIELNVVSGEAPVAVDDEYSTDEDTALVVNAANGVLANDSDPDSETLFAVLVDAPSNGTVELDQDGGFNYLPNADFFGTDTFTYQASDGSQTSNVATVTIVVDPIDDLPVAVDDFYEVPDAEPLVVDAANGVLANDLEADGEPLTAVLVTGPSDGVLELNADGSFNYTPDAGFAGRDTFTYRAVSNETESNIATVSIDVGDLTPSSIVGFVYGDTNHNGQLNEFESRFGGVRITLQGEDLFGRPVSLETLTDGDGAYRFDGVLRGNYVVTEFQPMGLLDGHDTIGSQSSLRNDRFIVDLPAGSVVGDYNFGERGLAPAYIRDPLFFASRSPNGMLAMINQAGGMEWYSLDTGWIGLDNVLIELSNNRSTAEVTVQDDLGRTDTTQVSLNVRRSARLLDSGTEGAVLQFTGDPADFGLIPVDAEGELDASSVDAAFGGSDA